VFGACVTQFTVIGLLFAYGLFFVIFEKEFGWPRAVLSGAMSLVVLSMGLLAAFSGRLSDLYGPRIVLSVSGIAFGFGVVLISQISEPWHLYIIFAIFIGVGMATHDVVTLSTVARWFVKRRGTMTGVVKVATAIGQICMPAILATLIALLGWRDAIMVTGIVAGLMLFGAAQLVRRPPEAEPASDSETDAAAEDATATPPPINYKAAIRTREFMMLCAAQFLFFPILGSIPLHMVAHGSDLGMSVAEAAVLVSTIGAASIAGRLVVGNMIDRIGGRRAYMLGLTPLVLSLLALLAIDTPWMLYGVMVLYGVGHGGMFTVVSPTIAEYYGVQSLGALFGTVLFFGSLGGAAGPFMTGVIYDWTGSYAVAFTILAAMGALALLLISLLPKKSAPLKSVD
jgi:MFS family permease